MITTGTPQDSLEAIRTKVMIRCGAAAGASFGFPLFESFIKDAHDQLWQMVDWKFLKTFNDQPSVIGERWYDLPSDCAMEKIERVVFKRRGSSIEYRMNSGIDESMRSIDLSGVPYRYEVRTNPNSPAPNAVQIEVYPKVSVDGIIRVYYERSFARFSEPSDLSVIPSDLVFLFALYNAQEHFGKPAMKSTGDQFKALLSSYRAKNRVKTLYEPRLIRGTYVEDFAYLVPPNA
jgi:hypothetical protein